MPFDPRKQQEVDSFLFVRTQRCGPGGVAPDRDARLADSARTFSVVGLSQRFAALAPTITDRNGVMRLSVFNATGHPICDFQ